MNWYKKNIFAQEVEQLINPNINREDLYEKQQDNFQPQQEKIIDPYLPYEKRQVSNHPDIKQWLLESFRILRRGKMPSGNDMFLLDEILPNTVAMKYWEFGEKVDKIADWRRNAKVNLDSYSPEQALDASNEWHRVLLEKSKNAEYEPTQSNMIVYGPRWKNKEWNGWTIQKVTGENDLLAEGRKMNHYTDSYLNDVQGKYSEIYSLRDPQNWPYITIEVGGIKDYTPGGIKQIMGYSDSSPEKKHKAMIKEWMATSAEEKGIVKRIDNFRDMERYIDNVQGVSQILLSIRKILNGEENEYGLQSILDYNMDKIINGLIAANENKSIGGFRSTNNKYTGDITNSSPYIVNLALMQDLKLSKIPNSQKEWIELKSSPKQSNWEHMLEISNWADDIIREIMEDEGGWGPKDIGIETPIRSDYNNSNEYNKVLREHYDDKTLAYHEILKGSIKGEFAEDLLNEIEKLRTFGFVPSKEVFYAEKERRRIEEREEYKKSPSQSKGVEKSRQRIQDVLTSNSGKNWYKKAIEEIEGMDVPGYGYRGAAIEELEKIIISGLNANSRFASDENDTNDYANGLWLRFPFPSNYEKKTGEDEHFIAVEAIPPDMIDFKTGLWEKWEPLK